MDIVLPRKLDKYGQRYGFVKLSSSREAESLIQKLRGRTFEGHKLRLDFAKKKKRLSNNSSFSKKGQGSAVNCDKEKGIQGPQASQVNYSESVARDRATTSQEKHDSNVLRVSANESNQLDFSQSVVVQTLQDSSVTDVMNQLDLLGYDNILVRGLCPCKFLLTFMDKSDFQNLDKDLLGLGFSLCRDMVQDDLIILRKAWVQCIGLPIAAWSLENFCILTKSWGELVGVSDMLSGDFFFQIRSYVSLLPPMSLFLRIFQYFSRILLALFS